MGQEPNAESRIMEGLINLSMKFGFYYKNRYQQWKILTVCVWMAAGVATLRYVFWKDYSSWSLEKVWRENPDGT